MFIKLTPMMMLNLSHSSEGQIRDDEFKTEEERMRQSSTGYFL